MEIKELFYICATAGLLNLETVQVGQFLISRPSFAGFILGLVCGCPLQCFFAGILIEAVYLDYTPIGGTVPPNGSVACAIFAGLAYKSHYYFSICFFMALFSGFIYAAADKKIREMKNAWNEFYKTEIENGKFKPWVWITISLIIDFIALLLCCALFITILRPLQFFFYNYPFIKSWTETAFLAVPFIAFSSFYFRLARQVKKNV